jgi:outer membrane protein OmpA-like peptidoglycan-associated protein/tetratricopeptide (TPR) repeat protein
MFMRYILFLLTLLLSLASFAQKEVPFTGTKDKKASTYFGEALTYFSSMDNSRALNLLNKALSEDPNFIDAWMLKADIFEQNEQYKEAIDIYKKVNGINGKFQIPYYKMAKAAIGDGEYGKASEFIRQYEELHGDQIEKAKVEKVKATAEFGAKALMNPVPYEPKNLGTGINTPLSDYFPGVTADEQTLIFTRLLNGRNEDFYISHKGEDGNWLPAQNMGAPINTERNEGTISLSSDGQYVFFTACNREGGAGSCDIYFSALDGDRWKEPRNLGFPVNTTSWESQPTVSFDGKTIYFASNRPGGYGDMDIWFSTYNKGRWSAPQNMGPEINTSGYEQAPLIAKDDQTLYFNSDGHTGMGGMDLFISRKKPDGRWGKAENLGYPINTRHDEVCMAMSANGEMAYIATEREGGKGGLDIYGFNLYKEARPAKTGYLKGIVFDSKTLQKLRARFELIDLATGKPVIESVSNRVTGEFLVCLQGNKNYALNVSAEGYLFHSENFALKEQPAVEPHILNIPLHPIQAGEKVVLKNIFFDVDQFTLKAESKVELEKLVSFLKANETVKVELSGHTDNTGVRLKNMELSSNRAKAVYDELVKSGIEARRLTYKGYADTQPVADNKTEAGRQQNRRTEFKILSR